MEKHPSNFKDLTGQKFNRLTVIRYAGVNQKSRAMWECVCECGNKCFVLGKNLRNGSTKSCGCLMKENQKTNGKKNATHGQRNTRLYNTWSHIKQRCYNPKHKNYKDYGGRGIKVCTEWLRFEPFYEWSLANGYREDLTIDRIDYNGDYTPDNCRWADDYTQHNNTRANNYLTMNGETHTIAIWSRKLNISAYRISRYIKKGYTLKELVNIPVKPTKHIIEINGEKKSIAEWCRTYGSRYKLVETRINRYGWEPLKALTTPARKIKKRA